MIKVLQVLPGIDRGGLETFVINIFRVIDRNRIHFDFLVNKESGDYADEIRLLGGNIYYIPPRSKGIRTFHCNLNHFFKEHKGEYDAVHYHESSLSSLEVLYYAWRANIPIRIMHSHSSSIIGSKLHYILHWSGKAVIGKLATHYFGCSDKAMDWLYNFSGVRSKAVLIQNGIDTLKFAYNPTVRNVVREELGIGDSFTLCHIGRFSKVKNHIFLLGIFRALKELKEDAKLILVGTGPLYNDIIETADNLGLTNDILFMGVRQDTERILQAADAFVMPSLYEGLPVVLVEAQASGLPIFCSDTISKMSKLTEQYYSISLIEAASAWANVIFTEAIRVKRKDCSDIVKNAGFDVHDIAGYLTQVYNSSK